MTLQQVLEIVGYLSSVLILISLLMTSVVKFRIINAVGSFIFTVYALCIHSYPTAILNACLVVVDLYFLIKVLRRTVLFTVEPCALTDSAAAHFLRFYAGDIRTAFPGLDSAALAGDACFLVYADAAPVGILVGTRGPEGLLDVALDYSAPSHRDCSVGKYLYGRLPDFGVTCLRAGGGTKKHLRYLASMGFTLQEGAYILTLN